MTVRATSWLAFAVAFISEGAMFFVGGPWAVVLGLALFLSSYLTGWCDGFLRGVDR